MGFGPGLGPREHQVLFVLFTMESLLDINNTGQTKELTGERKKKKKKKLISQSYIVRGMDVIKFTFYPKINTYSF